MARLNTVIEVEKPVYNEDGDLLGIDNKPWDINKDVKQQFVKEKYYLLHWGLETNFVYDQDSRPIPYSSTVGICQHIKTGGIQTFIPSVIKVVGYEMENLIKKERK
jgi:hypothetical protein